MILYLIEGIIAYALADLLTGTYHWATDHGWNIGSQVNSFQEHHESSEGVVFDFRPALLGLPILLLSIYWESMFFGVLGGSVTFCQFAHYYAHRPGKWLIKFLQRCWIILPPEHHTKHHSGDFNKNYCTLSGWNNWWLNYIL